MRQNDCYIVDLGAKSVPSSSCVTTFINETSCPLNIARKYVYMDRKNINFPGNDFSLRTRTRV